MVFLDLDDIDTVVVYDGATETSSVLATYVNANLVMSTRLFATKVNACVVCLFVLAPTYRTLSR